MATAKALTCTALSIAALIALVTASDPDTKGVFPPDAAESTYQDQVFGLPLALDSVHCTGGFVHNHAVAKPSYSILFLLFPWRSHVSLITVIAVELASRGHRVTLLTPEHLLEFAQRFSSAVCQQSPCTSITRLNWIPVPSVDFDDLAKARMPPMTLFKLFAETSNRMCTHIFKDPAVVSALASSSFDVLVADHHNECRLSITDAFDIPRIDVLSAGRGPNMLYRFNLKWSTAYLPVLGAKVGFAVESWTIITRLMNHLLLNMVHVKDKQVLVPEIEVFRKGLNISLPVDVSRKNVVMALVSNDWAFAQPFPVSPHVKYVGHLLQLPAKVLEPELKQLVDDSLPHGTIVVSFGSGFTLTQTGHATLIQAVSQLPQKVIYKLPRKDMESCMAHMNSSTAMFPNIIFKEWIPQNDLLGHPAVKLIVTHGGLNSILEAAHHGKPLVVVPFVGDQHENAAYTQQLGMARTLPEQVLLDSDVEGTLAHVQQVISNSLFSATAQRISRRFKARKRLPAAEAADWVEYAVDSGTEPFLRPYETELNWWVWACYDVYLLLAAVLLLAALSIAMLVRLMLWWCCKRNPKKSKVD